MFSIQKLDFLWAKIGRRSLSFSSMSQEFRGCDFESFWWARKGQKCQDGLASRNIAQTYFVDVLCLPIPQHYNTHTCHANCIPKWPILWYIGKRPEFHKFSMVEIICKGAIDHRFKCQTKSPVGKKWKNALDVRTKLFFDRLWGLQCKHRSHLDWKTQESCFEVFDGR